MATMNECYRGGDETGRPGWWFKFDYDEQTINSLKASVKHENRRWDPEQKRWWVFEPYEKTLLRMFRNFVSFKYQGKLL